MTALLRQYLIFDLNRRGACVFNFAHRAHHIQNAAEAGVAINDQWQPGCAHDHSREQAEFFEPDDTEIGEAETGAECGA